MTSKIIILKLGGSLVVPDKIDTAYLRRFSALIKKHLRRGRRFFIIVGGGRTSRRYRDAARTLGVKNVSNLHWLGIMATRLNAELVRALFGKLAHPETYWDFSKKIRRQKPVLVSAGWKPGVSTDYGAVLAARKFKAKTIINLTNVPFLYDKNPRLRPEARPLREISWKNYRKMFKNPRRHRPGENVPIDAPASLLSRKLRLETFYLSGHDIKNLDRLFSGKSWRGTRIY